MPASWILRLIAVGLLLSSVCCNDNWNQQFTEIKTMITLLDSKISTMDTRLGSLNVLDYAFKMNTVDNTMMMLNTRVDQIASQIDSIKESLRNLPSSPCTDPVRTQSPQHSRSSSTSEAALTLKLDDYGKKLLQSHSDIKSSSEEHHQSFTGFIDVVRSGFAKVIAKVDSFLALEGQMSTITSLVRQLSASTNLISEEVSSIVTGIAEVKISVSDSATSNKNLETQISTSPSIRQLLDAITLVSGDVSNVKTDITEVKRSVSNFTTANKAVADFVTEVKNSISFPVSGLGQALEESKQLQSQISQLNIIEDKVTKAASLSNRLLAEESMKSLPSKDKEIAQNLTKFLAEIENITVPLFLSLKYNFEHIRAIMSDSFATLANRTQCRSDESMKLQIAKLRELFPKSNQNADEASRSDDVFAYCGNTIEDLVLENTSDVKIPLLKLQSHLKFLVDISEKSQSLESGGQDWDKPLRTLLG